MTTYLTWTMSDLERSALADSFAASWRMSVVDALKLHFVSSIVAASFPARVHGTDVVALSLMLAADEQLESVTRVLTDDVHQHSDKFDPDMLHAVAEELLLSGAAFVPAAEHSSCLCVLRNSMPTIDTADSFGRLVIVLDGNHDGAVVSVVLFVA